MAIWDTVRNPFSLRRLPAGATAHPASFRVLINGIFVGELGHDEYQKIKRNVYGDRGVWMEQVSANAIDLAKIFLWFGVLAPISTFWILVAVAVWSPSETTVTNLAISVTAGDVVETWLRNAFTGLVLVMFLLPLFGVRTLRNVFRKYINYHVRRHLNVAAVGDVAIYPVCLGTPVRSAA